MKRKEKIFVLDTNIILHDYRCIWNFQDNDLVIPIAVLEELDKFKKGNDALNYNARGFIRELDRLTKDHPLGKEGVPIGEHYGDIKIELNHPFPPHIADCFTDDIPDHRILSTAIWARDNNPDRFVALVTKDVNLRMKAKAIGMEVIAYNRSRHPEGEEIGEYVGLDTLLTRADIISLHCPLTAENTGLINRDTIAKMKDGVILLNTARGGLLSEQDVADALRSGKLRYAAVDVVSKEPIDPDNPLLTVPNCIITPHMAWAPIEARQRILDCTVRSIEGFLAGKPVNTVN